MLRHLLTRGLRAKLAAPVRRRSAKRPVTHVIERLEDRRVLATWSGDIPNGTVWTNTEVQRITGDVRVPVGSTLTIQPGTVIKVNDFAALGMDVEG